MAAEAALSRAQLATVIRTTVREQRVEMLPPSKPVAASEREGAPPTAAMVGEEATAVVSGMVPQDPPKEMYVPPRDKLDALRKRVVPSDDRFTNRAVLERCEESLRKLRGQHAAAPEDEKNALLEDIVRAQLAHKVALQAVQREEEKEKECAPVWAIPVSFPGATDSAGAPVTQRQDKRPRAPEGPPPAGPDTYMHRKHDTLLLCEVKRIRLQNEAVQLAKKNW